MDFHLQIKREDFLKTLKHFGKLCKPNPQEEALLSYDMKKFSIELGGMKILTEAEGTWEKDVRVSHHAVMGLARIHLQGDPVLISVEDNHLKIGTIKFNNISLDVSNTFENHIPELLEKKFLIKSNNLFFVFVF